MTLARDRIIPPGKLPARLLRRLLKRYADTASDPAVVVGPSVGIDSAVIKPPPGYIVAKTDPITFTSAEIGNYTIQINANDIAVMGGTPRWFLATILLAPDTATEREAERVFRELSNACRGSGVTLSGGHTEVTGAVTQTVVVGQMLGTVRRTSLVTAAGARAGDALILTKGVAIEGTSLIARELGPRLVRSGAFTGSFIKRCQGFTLRPGLSVAEDAAAAMEAGAGGVHAMHDPTEGGLATGLYELAEASGLGIEVNEDAIRVLPEARRLCTHLGLDPMGLIASGALLIAASPGRTEKIIGRLAGRGIPAAQIGAMTDAKKGVMIRVGGKAQKLKPFERDEITKVL